MDKLLSRELKKVKKLVWPLILRYLPNKYPSGHYRSVSEYPRRQGKYFRPALCLFTNAMYGGKTSDALLAAAAIQASEDWLLIHDDVEDHSNFRRGQLSLNALYGEEIAINAGDALHVKMWRMLGDNIKRLGLKQGLPILEKMSEILLMTFEGQYLELEWTRRDRLRVSENDYLDMVKRKTSYYTVVGPAQLGALCAGKGQPRIMKAIESWGIPFGCAFQILDDLSDVSNEMQDLSKARGGDIQESKRTLILIHLLKHANPKEKKKVMGIYQKPAGTKTQKDKRLVINLFHKYDSLNYVRDIAVRYAREAEQAFLRSTSNLPDSEPKKSILMLIRHATGLKM